MNRSGRVIQQFLFPSFFFVPFPCCIGRGCRAIHTNAIKKPDAWLPPLRAPCRINICQNTGRGPRDRGNLLIYWWRIKNDRRDSQPAVWSIFSARTTKTKNEKKKDKNKEIEPLDFVLKLMMVCTLRNDDTLELILLINQSLWSNRDFCIGLLTLKMHSKI